MKQRAKFLGDRAAIRAAIVDSFRAAKSADVAVAFIGHDWAELIGQTKAQLRVICWFASTATNPIAVCQMLERGIRVRQVDEMHAKVYLTYGQAAAAIVGSANLSRAGLSSDDALGRHEAALVVRGGSELAVIAKWFEQLWRASSEITNQDIQAATAAWRAARQSGRRGARRPKRHLQSAIATSSLPRDWVPSKRLQRLASEVRTIDLEADDTLGQQHPFFRDLEPRKITRAQLVRVVELISHWTRHAGAHQPVYREPLSRVRAAFDVAFDEGLDLHHRLALLDVGGARKIAGFAITAWTMLLAYRNPRERLPYNWRTRAFLRDFGLSRYVKATLTPLQYEQWISFAQDLSERLDLPTAGHVDRMVWADTSGYDDS